MRFFDFFAGIGGFRLGMEMAGHECVGHCEIDKYAQKSYIAMHHPKESEVFIDDIRTVKPADMPECDCYCFGFPCQSFSIAGKRGGFADTRGTLFFEVMRLAQARHPRLLLAENVKGLLNHNGGATFETIIRTMDELGYLVEWQVLNSKDHGVPQNRERVFIVGHLRGAGGREVFPLTGDSREAPQLPGDQDQISLCLYERIGQHGASNGVYPMSDGGIMSVNNWKKRDIKQMNRPPHIHERIYHESGISPCIVTGTGGNLQPSVIVRNATKGGVVDVKHQNVRVRRLTPRECFRLQGFPDDYFDRAAEVCSDSQLYKQAGNAVTVNVVYQIAKRLSL